MIIHFFMEIEIIILPIESPLVGTCYLQSDKLLESKPS